MFKQTVLVSLVIFSAQCVQASQQAATPMPSSSAACPATPARVKYFGRRQTDPNFGAAVHERFVMGMWAADNSTSVPSVISKAKQRMRLVALAINASDASLANPAQK